MSDVNTNMIGTRGTPKQAPEVTLAGRAYRRPATECNLGVGADGLPKYCILDNALSTSERDTRLEALRVLAKRHSVESVSAKSKKVSADESS